MTEMTRTEWEAWTQGLRRGAEALAQALRATGTHVQTEDLDAQLFAIWRKAIHDLLRTHPEYHCAQWCWMAQPREEQLARFRGRLSFQRFRRLLMDALEVHCDRTATPAAPRT